MPFPKPPGGGAATHAGLPDVTADQHHAALHDIDGANHDGFPGGGTTFLRDDGVFAAPPGGGGAPADADYLVGTAHAGLSAEIVVGPTPAGELGGTWGAPTVDATHSGSAHHAAAHAIDGADHTGVLVDGQIPASIARDSELHAALHDIDGANHDGFPGGTSTFLRADGTFAAPTAAAADPVYSPGSFTVATESGRYIPARMKLTTTQRATIAGTGRLVLTN